MRVWQYDEGTCMAVMEGHGAGVQCIALSPDDQHIVAVDAAGAVMVWPVPA